MSAGVWLTQFLSLDLPMKATIMNYLNYMVGFGASIDGKILVIYIGLGTLRLI